MRFIRRSPMPNVLLLALAQALAGSGIIVMVLLGGILGAQLAPDPRWATLPVSIAVIGLAASTIPAALLMQRIGRKQAFMLSAALAALASLGVAWAVWRHDFTLFCLAIVPMGANLAFVQQYRFAAVEYVPAEHAARAVGLVMLGTLGAALFAPPLALLARHWVTGVEYVGSFIAVALLYVGAIVTLAFLGRPLVQATHDHEPARPLRVIARSPAFIVAVLAGLSSYAVMSFIMTATPISMHVMDRHSVTETAWVIQSHLLGMYLPSLFSGWLIAWLGVKRMMLVGVVLMGACIVIAAGGSHHVMHYWWGLVLLGAGWNLLFVAGTTLLTRTYRPSERFKAQAVNEFSVFGSQAVASLLAGPAIHYLGWRWMNLAAAPLLVAMLVGLVVIYRRESGGSASSA